MGRFSPLFVFAGFIVGKKFEAKRRKKLAQEKVKQNVDIENMTVFGHRYVPTKGESNIRQQKTFRRHTENYPSAKAMPVEPEQRKQVSEEMQKREQAAQAEIEHKKSRVAPLFNKGAYQYITDEYDTKDIGRK